MTLRLALLACLLIHAQAMAQESTALMADTTSTPRISAEWPTASGPRIRLEGERAYRSPADKSDLGRNILAYVALGGTRLDKGFGDPSGATVRLGLYKKDMQQPFFEDIADGGSITLTIDNIRMNKPAEPRPRTAIMHERYSLTDLTSCGLDANARNLIVTADPQDPIRAKVQAESTRLGGLDGGPDHGKAEAKVQPDGSVSITITFPYALLRHVRDPNLRTKPGAFFEPQHFHIEMELVPSGASIDPPARPSLPPAAPPAAPTTPSDPRAVYLRRSTGNGEPHGRLAQLASALP